MNTTAPTQDKDTMPVSGQPVVQATVSGVTAVPAPQGKEYEPGQSLTEYATLPGSELEPDLAPELKDAGVAVSPNTEQPRLSVEDKRLGVTHGIDALSHTLTTPGSKPLPMTKEEAKAIIENKKIKWFDSIKGFALNMFRQNEKKEAQE